MCADEGGVGRFNPHRGGEIHLGKMLQSMSAVCSAHLLIILVLKPLFINQVWQKQVPS